MAESAVGFVISLLSEKANLLSGIHGEVDGIKRELQSIHAFLKDADRMAETAGDANHGVKLWVEELVEVAFDIECVIDEYTQHKVQEGEQSSWWPTRLLKRLKPTHSIASEIADLRQRVKEINRRSVVYGFNVSQQGSSGVASQWSDPRDHSRLLEKTEVVGRKAEVEELTARLLNGGSLDRNVISLVGMPGIGKTTLANQVYESVKKKFDCHAWIDVSQSYNKTELQRNLLRKFFQSLEVSLPKEIDSMEHFTLTRSLKKCLKEKSYIVMFDDVWNPNFWVDIETSLPTTKTKSGTIFITTRNVEFANFCKMSSSVHIHTLEPLSSENSWELFCSKAFHSQPNKACPPNLENLSHELVKRCDGLPLAIAVIGGLLATKGKTEDEWRKLLSSLSSELESNPHLKSITKILALSYRDLPYYLKYCFLYLGIFPEDYSARSGRLIREWIAEGFVKPAQGKTSEIVAEEYLVKLINRSMIQVSEVDFDGKAKSCRVHDLLRELILKTMEDLNFCRLLSHSQSNLKRSKTHRLSIFRCSQDDFGSDNTDEISRVRSVFMFDNEIPNFVAASVGSKMKLLKVLDFEDAPDLDHLPEDIGNMFHLRYLSVRGTKVKLLPKSIGKLENLETLDLKQSLVYEIPAEIKGLRKLQYLFAYHDDHKVDYHLGRQSGVKIEKGIGQLKALKKLFHIDARTGDFDLFKEICELTELKKLGIKKLRCEQASINEDEIIDLESISSPPEFLQRLRLMGSLRKFPEWITKLSSLIRISLLNSKLEDDPLKALQKLPNLLSLEISYDAYYGEHLCFEEYAFPKLKRLWFRGLSKLQKVVFKIGALSNLEQLAIGPSPLLKELPYGVEHLKSLKLLVFCEMPTYFLLFENFQSLKFIKDVRFICKTETGRFRYDLESILCAHEYVREHKHKVDWDSLSFEDCYNKYRHSNF